MGVTSEAGDCFRPPRPLHATVGIPQEAGDGFAFGPHAGTLAPLRLKPDPDGPGVQEIKGQVLTSSTTPIAERVS